MQINKIVKKTTMKKREKVFVSVQVSAQNNGLLKDSSEEEFNEGIIYREEVRLRTNKGTTKSGSHEEVGACGIKSTGRRYHATLGLYEGVYRCYGIAIFLYSFCFC